MGHRPGHSHTATSHGKAFGFGITLNVLYIALELIFGIIINSTALIADAGHNLSDVLGLSIAWGASVLAKSSTTASRTYGFRKSTILAALLNAIILLIAVGAITIEAIRKIIQPEPIGGTTMMVVAGIGVVINSFTALLFVKGKEKDINIKGAFLHMAADAGVSLGVVVAGLLINLTGFFLIDPIVSLVIVAVITIGTWELLKDSFHLSMDAVPNSVQLDRVRAYLSALPGVEEVHDLHIWAISTTEIALTGHLVMPTESADRDDKFLNNVCRELHDQFGIEHSTIQIENGAQSAACSDNHV